MNVSVASLPAQTRHEKRWPDTDEGTGVQPCLDVAEVIERYTLRAVDLAQTLLDLPTILQTTLSQSASVVASGVQEFIQWLEEASTVSRTCEPVENSTEKLERAGEIDAEVDSLLESAGEQNFEDGMESEFSRELVRIVKTYGGNAIAALATRVMSGTVNPEVAAEALRSLGRIDAPIAYRERFYLLEHSLGASSAWIRDGASLGLALLDDPQAIPYLKQAIQRERIAELRQDLGRVLSQLENTDQCRCF